MKFTKVAMQDPLGDIDRHGHLDLMMYKKLNKGAMQGTLGDIGRHGDSKTNNFTNLTQGAMQGHSETTWVIQVDIGTLKLFIVEIL